MATQPARSLIWPRVASVRHNSALRTLGNSAEDFGPAGVCLGPRWAPLTGLVRRKQAHFAQLGQRGPCRAVGGRRRGGERYSPCRAGYPSPASHSFLPRGVWQSALRVEEAQLRYKGPLGTCWMARCAGRLCTAGGLRPLLLAGLSSVLARDQYPCDDSLQVAKMLNVLDWINEPELGLDELLRDAPVPGCEAGPPERPPGCVILACAQPSRGGAPRCLPVRDVLLTCLY